VKHFDVQKHVNHIDLRYIAAKQGEKGGLKPICERLGFKSPPYLNSLDGEESIRLWQEYNNRKNNRALKQLLHYNAWDVVMTYRLHRHLQGKDIQPIEEDMPFKWT